MIEGLFITLMVLFLLVSVIGGVAWWRSAGVERERSRIANETRVAEWQLRTMARSAMLQMLDETRRHDGRAGR